MLALSDIATYTVALAIAAAIPGPGMTAIVARSVGSGAKAGFAMLLGIAMGDLIYLSFAVFGLAIVAQNFSAFFSFIRWASIVYLLYLAWQFWYAKHNDLESKAQTHSALGSAAISGLAITLGNPKTIAFYLALLPLVLDLNNISVTNWAMVLVPVTISVLLLIGAVFILGAISIRRILRSARAQRQMYRGASLVMAGAAGSMLLREL